MSSMGDAAKAELVLDARNGTGESPVWHGAEQALYWVDIPARKLWRWTPSTGEATSWLAPEMLACIAPTAAANSWIAGAESGIFRLTTKADGLLGFDLLAPVSHALPGMRFNDGRCDRQGRFLAGTMLMIMAAGARQGCIYSYQKESCLSKFLDGFITPNAPFHAARQARPFTRRARQETGHVRLWPRRSRHPVRNIDSPGENRFIGSAAGGRRVCAASRRSRPA